MTEEDKKPKPWVSDEMSIWIINQQVLLDQEKEKQLMANHPAFKSHEEFKTEKEINNKKEN
jgi:hypothetical protein